MKKGLTTLSFLLFIICIFPSYGNASNLKIAVSIPPQKWLCQKIGGNLVTTEVLVAKGQDPHTFEPSPRQMAALLKSKLYFTLGLDFEFQVLKKIDQSSSKIKVVDTSLHQNGDKDVSGHEDTNRAQVSHHEQDSHHDKEGHHEEESHRPHHDHEGEDPHIWLSPVLLKEVAEVMASAMSDEDPKNAGMYGKNLDLLLAELDQLHATIQKRLAPYEGASFYVFHPAFGQFAATYGLVQEAVEIEGKEPSPKQLKALISKARSENVRIIFVQPQFDVKSAEAVANAIEGEVIPLDALAEDVASNLTEISKRIESALATR